MTSQIFQDIKGDPTFTIPEGVDRLQFELWAAGNDGIPGTITSAGAGGAAGCYIRSIEVVKPGDVISVTVGDKNTPTTISGPGFTSTANPGAKSIGPKGGKGGEGKSSNPAAFIIFGQDGQDAADKAGVGGSSFGFTGGKPGNTRDGFGRGSGGAGGEEFCCTCKSCPSVIIEGDKITPKPCKSSIAGLGAKATIIVVFYKNQ